MMVLPLCACLDILVFKHVNGVIFVSAPECRDTVPKAGVTKTRDRTGPAGISRPVPPTNLRDRHRQQQRQFCQILPLFEGAELWGQFYSYWGQFYSYWQQRNCTGKDKGNAKVSRWKLKPHIKSRLGLRPYSTTFWVRSPLCVKMLTLVWLCRWS